MSTVVIALLGGVLPALIWLAFWLTEDRCQPEPKSRIILTFLAGMMAVGVVLPLERYLAGWEPSIAQWASHLGPSVEFATPALIASAAVLLIWAAVEELGKLLAASVGIMSSAYDEPLDAIIYLTTAALGFAAAENVLYLLSSLGNSTGLQSLLTGDLRFVGATLLHTLASATIGLSMALFFYSRRAIRICALVGGVILAVGLHVSFNFSILWGGSARALYVFLPIWIGIIILLALTERIKNPAKDYC